MIRNNNNSVDPFADVFLRFDDISKFFNANKMSLSSMNYCSPKPLYINMFAKKIPDRYYVFKIYLDWDDIKVTKINTKYVNEDDIISIEYDCASTKFGSDLSRFIQSYMSANV